MAYVVHKSSLTKERVPLSLNVSDESLYGLYLGDIGTSSYQSKVNPTTFIDKNSRNVLSDVFFKNYVADHLYVLTINCFIEKAKAVQSLNS